MEKARIDPSLKENGNTWQKPICDSKSAVTNNMNKKNNIKSRKACQGNLQPIDKVYLVMKELIKNSPSGRTTIPQTELAKLKKIKMRRSTVAMLQDQLVEQGKLIRHILPNGKRKNPMYGYTLGTSTKDHPIATQFPLNFFGIEGWSSLNRMELIESYMDAGLFITPLKPATKEPCTGWTKIRTANYTKSYILDFFAANEDVGVGCWVPEGYVAVDVDDLDAFYTLNGGEDYDTLKMRSRRGLHYWFKHDGSIRPCNEVRKDVVDYKSSGSLVALPPTIHHSGFEYSWDQLGVPIDAPQFIYDLYETRLEHRAVRLGVPIEISEIPAGFKKVKRTIARIPYITEASRIEEGDRYNELFRLGRHLKVCKAKADDITNMIHRLNKQCCQPPLDDKRMKLLMQHIFMGRDRPGFKPVNYKKD